MHESSSNIKCQGHIDGESINTFDQNSHKFNFGHFSALQ